MNRRPRIPGKLGDLDYRGPRRARRVGALWSTFDEPRRRLSTETPFDLSAMQNDGTVGGGVTLVEGPGGFCRHAVEFNGSDGYIEYESPEGTDDEFLYQVDEDHTLAFLFKGGSAGYMFSKHNSGQNGWGVLANGGASRIRYRMASSGGARLNVDAATNWDDGDWHLGMITKAAGQAASNATIYVDNVDDTGSIIQDTLGLDAYVSEPFNIGARSGGTAARAGFSDVTIAYVAGWAKLLDSDERDEVFNGAATNPPDLTKLSTNGYLDFYQCPGLWVPRQRYQQGTASSVVEDLSGNNVLASPVGVTAGNLLLRNSGLSKRYLSSGASRYFTAPAAETEHLNFDWGDAFTIFFRAQVAASATGYFISRIDGSQVGWGVYAESTGTLQVWLGDPTDPTNRVAVETSGPLNGSWRDYAVTIDGSGTAAGISVYSVLALAGSGFTWGTPALSTIHDSAGSSMQGTGPLNLSGRTNGTSRLNGNLQMPMIFRGELSFAEVQQISVKQLIRDPKTLPFGGQLLGGWRIGERFA